MATVVEVVLSLLADRGITVEARPLADSCSVLDILASGIIVRRLRVVASPLPFVIIAGGCPSALIALLVLDLLVRSAYFPARFYRYIKPSKRAVTIWKTPARQWQVQRLLTKVVAKFMSYDLKNFTLEKT